MVFLTMALWELCTPRRPLHQSKIMRWLSNLSLTVIDTAVVQFTIGALAVTTAVYVTEHRWGLLHLLILPTWAKGMIGFLILDFGIYLQHIFFHRIPLFWRLHQVHHTDLDFDVTTGIRFHPLEIILSLLYKGMIILAIGVDPVTVVIFEIVLNAAALFNHSNIYLPLWIDKPLRWFLVTPDVHRVHHSTIPLEFNTNFGFSITWWDRLFGTFMDQPASPHTEMEIGLKEFRNQKELHLFGLLKLPFLRHN